MGKKSRRARPKSNQSGGANSGGKATNGPRPSQPPPSDCGQQSPVQPPMGASCYICLDGDPDDEGKPIVRDCSCRGQDAGFAHLSCLVRYARTKTGELLENGENGAFLSPCKCLDAWQKCPQCHHDFQRQVSLDMLNSALAFINEAFPGHEFRKVGVYQAMLNTILSRDFDANPELREEGKRLASQMISIIEEESIHEKGNIVLLGFAYAVLGRLSEADKTKDGYDMAIYCLNKVRDWYQSDSCFETEYVDFDNRIDIIKARRDEDQDRMRKLNEGRLGRMQAAYYDSVKEYGEEDIKSMKNGIILVKTLEAVKRTIECERLAKKLATTSRQVYGQGHPITKEINFYLEHKRGIGANIKETGIEEFEVLRPAEKEGWYIVKRPVVEEARQNSEGESVLTVPIDDFVLAQGTPVVCHGLKKASHLNGKLGEVVLCADCKTSRYEVRFEDKSMKSVLVRPGNLRIVFELPDE
ncbi:hypothetical protein ACHAWF_008983 [Thalassiosira exigua]